LTNHFLYAILARMAQRQSAAERREAILDAAVEVMAAKGVSGATTADIARRAGISQPYVFKFFPTKRDLVLAVNDRCANRIIANWQAAVPKPGETRLETLGRTYVETLPERRGELLVLLYGYGAAQDPVMADAMRERLARVYRYIVGEAEKDGCEDPHDAAARFVGRGFFINVAMAVGLESELTKEEWSGICPLANVARVDDRLERVGS
jgi:AcrR family transcriptional regulator